MPARFQIRHDVHSCCVSACVVGHANSADTNSCMSVQTSPFSTYMSSVPVGLVQLLAEQSTSMLHAVRKRCPAFITELLHVSLKAENSNNVRALEGSGGFRRSCRQPCCFLATHAYSLTLASDSMHDLSRRELQCHHKTAGKEQGSPTNNLHLLHPSRVDPCRKRAD